MSERKNAKTCNNCDEEMKIIDHDKQSGALTGPREKVIWACPECHDIVKKTETSETITKYYDPELRMQLSDKLSNS